MVRWPSPCAADLDALPIVEEDGPVRSTVHGVCHACGHDVHTTVLLGVGLLLAQLADGALAGRVRLIFQPAEESCPAARWRSSRPAAWTTSRDLRAALRPANAGRPGRPAGRPDHRGRRPRHRPADRPGGHTARPHLTVDLVDALGRLITEVPALCPAGSTPRGARVVWGRTSAGTAVQRDPGRGRRAAAPCAAWTGTPGSRATEIVDSGGPRRSSPRPGPPSDLEVQLRRAARR